MKKIVLFTSATVLASLPLSAAISVVGGLPSGALISNPDVLDGSGGADGASRLAFPATTSNYFTKGESFTLTGATGLTAFTVRIDENNAPADGVGDVTLSIYNLSGVPDDTQATGQVPTGAALVSQTETLPTIAVGDYLTVTLDTALNLAAGNYAFVFSTQDIDVSLDINRPGSGIARNQTYTGGEVIRANSAGTWQDRNFDLVFAIEQIPEPTSSLLAGIGLLALLRRRR